LTLQIFVVNNLCGRELILDFGGFFFKIDFYSLIPKVQESHWWILEGLGK